jgi:SAM-dependent methyltransferase
MNRQRLEDHRDIWRKKPQLALIYQKWFDDLLAALPGPNRVLEVGSGPGFFAAYAKHRSPDTAWLAMDILDAPGADIVGDGQRIPLRDHSVDALAGLDVLHHIGQPLLFFEEAARTLTRSGRLALIEPWVSVFSYPIYRWLHHEGCNLSLDPWNPFGMKNRGAKDAFQGDAAVVRQLVRRTPERKWLELGFSPPRVKLLNGFAYLLSGGFKPFSLIPAALVPAFSKLDDLLSKPSPYLAMRALVVWDRMGRQLND